MAVAALADRGDYPTLREGTYLNQAALGLIGQPAVDAMHAMLDGTARHGNLHMSDEEEAAFLGDLRGHAARLLAADPARVAIVSSASELLSQAPFLLAPPPGSTVLAVATDFPAITRPWLRLAEHGGCTVEFVADRAGADLTDDLIDRIDADTSVVAVGWVQYATGTTIDFARLRAATEHAGVRLVLDVTQGAGAMAVDADGWGADLLVTSGYKWLGGHGGVALAVLAEDLTAQVPPLPGWFGAADPFAFDATDLSLAPDARRFTQSTMSYVSVTGLTTSIGELLRLGIGEVERHATRLADALVAGTEPLGWRPYRQPGDPAAAANLVALTPPTGSIDGVAQRLRSHAVVCSVRGGRLRVSLAPYNDQDDIESLVAALG